MNMDIEELNAERIKALCIAHGGQFHGPKVEHFSIPEYLLPALFKAVAEIALEHLTTTNQSLMAEVERLRGQVPVWKPAITIYREHPKWLLLNPCDDATISHQPDKTALRLVIDTTKFPAPPKALHAEEVKP